MAGYYIWLYGTQEKLYINPDSSFDRYTDYSIPEPKEPDWSKYTVLGLNARLVSVSEDKTVNGVVVNGNTVAETYEIKFEDISNENFIDSYMNLLELLYSRNVLLAWGADKSDGTQYDDSLKHFYKFAEEGKCIVVRRQGDPDVSHNWESNTKTVTLKCRKVYPWQV